ncbi:MAG: TIGR00366 family protein [Halobacteriales archaeon]|nr:TIGR00366 family protein [Halobacteriales archaeon]
MEDTDPGTEMDADSDTRNADTDTDSNESSSGLLQRFLDTVGRVGEWFSEWSLKYIPDPYAIAIILTFVTFAAVLGIGESPTDALGAWTDGIWTLLPFMATLAFLLMAGDAIAKSPAVTRVLERIAAVPSSQFTAVAFTAFVAMAAALISWALGLIVGATMAKRVGYEMKQKDVKVHYPLLVAAGYTSLMAYGHGLTSSAALIMADPALIPSTFPDYTLDGIPLSRTIGNPANIVSGILVVVFVPLLMGAMHPNRGPDIIELPDSVEKDIAEVVEEMDKEKEPEPMHPEKPLPGRLRGHWRELRHGEGLTVADRLNNSRVLGLAIAFFPAYYFVDAIFLSTGSLSLAGGLAGLTLNSINAIFLFVAIVLWTTPIRLVEQMKDSVQTISGIIFQFPFYAGIAGLLTGTGLAELLTRSLADVATPLTWPILGIVVAGITNIFIPSGGGQWVAQGPILLETTRELGLPPELAVIIEMLGDQLTNMVQPFWAIPLLAIANLRARDIIGYTTVAMFLGYVIVGATLTVFFGLG